MSVSIEIVNEYYKYLLDNKKLLDRIKKLKGLKDSTIDRFKIGYNPMSKRYTIPIMSADEKICHNIRFYDPDDPTGKFKMISVKGSGEVRLFPLNHFRDMYDNLIYCEGEWDAIIANQNGYNVLTPTGGVGTWKDYYIEKFSGKNVSIVFDCQDVSRIAAKKISKEIKKVANWVKIIDLGLKDKEDISDWFIKYDKTVSELDLLIDGTEASDGYKDCSLQESLNSKYFDAKIKFHGVIIGKDLSPYIIPSAIKAKCMSGATDKKICLACPLSVIPIEKKFNYTDDKIILIQMIKANDMQLVGYIRQFLGIPAGRNCPGKWDINITERANVEEIIIIPEIDHERIDENYVQRKAYYFGYDIEANQAHLFKGTAWADPGSQMGIHLIEHAQGSKDNISKFELTDEIKEQLKIFQPEEDTIDHIRFKLKDIQQDLTHNVTLMHKRENIIMALDLVYHSVLSFKFLGRDIEKGWLECTIIGDTKCGKSETTKQIVRHYKCGEFLTSTENTTEAGLLGGLQQTSRGSWTVTWGKFVMNNKGIIFADEIDNLARKGILGLLSGVRSSGIVELVKIQSQKAMAKTRIVFISNPLWGRMAEHNYGVEVIREIFKTQQDMSRIDFAIAVGGDDVDDKLINTPMPKDTEHKYTSELCHNSVMFAWSRKTENIIFEKETEETILKLANQMGEDFSQDIPLVIGAEMRIKLARMAVAVATRLYSTDETGENVIVKRAHVLAVSDFLYGEYCGDVMGYKEYSDQRFREKTIGDVEFFELKADSDLAVINSFLDLGTFHISDIEDILALSHQDAKEFVSKMRQNRLIKRKHTFYVKMPGFIKWLKEIKNEMSGNKGGIL